MRMTSFRVQNYKKIHDTGVVTCDDLIVLVGKNESGKSSIFRGLSKLNPSDGEKYDPLKEFPRRRYTAEFKERDWPVASVDFTLTDDERAHLAGIAPLLNGVQSISCTRHYSWKFDVSFAPPLDLPDVSVSAFQSRLGEWQKVVEQATAPEGRGEGLGQLKTKLLPALSQLATKAGQLPKGDPTPAQIIGEAATAVAAQLNEVWQKEQFQPVSAEIDRFRRDMESVGKLVEAKSWVEQNIPRFVYFDRYDVIDSAIHFPTFIQQLQ